jgi:hypothetical protein
MHGSGWEGIWGSVKFGNEAFVLEGPRTQTIGFPFLHNRYTCKVFQKVASVHGGKSS